MKNYPHTIAVLILALAAFLTLGCQSEPQTPQEQAIVEENAPAEALAPVVETPVEQTVAAEAPAAQVPAEVPTTPEQPEAPAPEVKQEVAAEMPTAEPPAEAVVEAAPEPQAPEAVAEAPEPQAAEPAVSPDEVIVTVDDVAITEGEVAERIDIRIEQMKKRGMPQEMVDSQKADMRDPFLQGLILETLLNNELKKAGIAEVSPERVDAEIEKLAKLQNTTMEEMVKMLESNGQSLDDMKKYYTKVLTYRDLLKAKRGDEMNVTDEDAKAYYDSNQRLYAVPERVRASHILISPDKSDPNADPNQTKAAAKAKAEDILKQIKDGADFAELAKANSSCPSASSGGDLNFFGRGQMAKPFEDAAFALQVGQISDVVETQFGFHIIKLTDRQEAKTTSFEEARADIIEKLQSQKENQVGGEYVEELRSKAEIVYAEGKEPKPQQPAIQATPVN
jgi:peptidyl-prolyl cis-trans isomerase C